MAIGQWAKAYQLRHHLPVDERRPFLVTGTPGAKKKNTHTHTQKHPNLAPGTLLDAVGFLRDWWHEMVSFG